jgi:long-chain acyl-CoA synthetase
MRKSLADFFRETFETHRYERAYGQRHGYRMKYFTYGQILKMATAARWEIWGRGVRKGDRVLLWGHNCAEWVAAYLGCVLCGAVVVPMDDSASVDFSDRVVQEVRAKVRICSRKHSENEGGDKLPVLTLEELSTLDQDFIAPIEDIVIDHRDTLQIVFTSGTTAEPKGVVITHGNVLANIEPFEKEMKRYLKYEHWVHPVRFLNLLPLSHVFGQFLGMFLPPLLGATVIFQEEFSPAEIMNTIRRERVSVLVSVPRVLQSLKQKIERDLDDAGKRENFRQRFRESERKNFLLRWWIFRGIRRQFGWKFWAFISGGATLDTKTEEFWGRLGYAVIQGYGLTETTSLISVNHPFKLGKASIGKVLPGRDVKLAGDGEILVRGGGVAETYWEGGREREAVEKDGWYHTGDIGALDESGSLYFKGRKKDVIVTPAGLNIYPADLEAALRLQPEVKDCVVVGIDRSGNAEPCAVLILRSEANAETVVGRANQSLAEYQRMNMWAVWPQDDFPRTSTQKPRRNLIAEFAAGEIQDGRKNDVRCGSVLEMIQQITGRSISGLKRGLDADLNADLGLSSLDRVELLSALEDRYQVDMGEAGFSSVRTVGDMERMLRGDNRQRVEYHYPEWVLRWPVTWVRWLAHYVLMRPAMLGLGWPRIEGRENLSGCDGPLLVVCNHINDVDVGFVHTALPARFRNRIATATGGEALEKLRSPAQGRNFAGKFYDKMQWVLGVSLLNLFPLPREAGFRKSFAYAGRAVDQGYSVLVFPEGRHTLDGKINPFRTGVGLLAKNLGIPVLPMRIHGLFELKHAGKKFAAPGKIRIRIGTPMTFAAESDPAQIARELQKAIEDL